MQHLVCALCCSAPDGENGVTEERPDAWQSAHDVKLSNTVFPELFPTIEVTKKVLRSFLVLILLPVSRDAHSFNGFIAINTVKYSVGPWIHLT